MDNRKLQSWIEATKDTVLLAIFKHLPAEISDRSEDVFQETYIKFFKKFQSEEPESGVASAWLYVVARNECKKQFRSYNRENRRIYRLADWIKNRPDPLEREQDKQDAIAEFEALEKLVDLLPDHFAQVFRYRLKGLSVEEISGILSIPEGTVKSRLSRGRESLLRMMNGATLAGGIKNEVTIE